MKMYASFLMHGDPTGAGFRKSRNIVVGIFNHQVTIENRIGKSFSKRGHDQRPNRDIRHEVAVHHVDMEHRAAAFQRRFRVLAQSREVCGKNRGCQFNGHGLRATPSLPQGKEIIRGSSSMLAEKCDANEKLRITMESYSASGCSCALTRVCA